MSTRNNQFNRQLLWRILQPIILGCTANIIVNYVFSPENPAFLWSEFLAAILFSLLITELNFHIGRRLEKKYSWTQSFKKRFLYHLGLLTICVLFVLNGIGNVYMWLFYSGLYTLNELLVINFVLFVVLLIITFLDWGTSFYRSWAKTEKDLEKSQVELEQLSTSLKNADREVILHQGKKQIKVPIKQILIAKSEHGIVRVSFDDGHAIYQHSLQHLIEDLPEALFFQVARNAVLRREMITSISSSTFGKIRIETKEFNDSIIVSRQKAAAFRKWYHSDST